MIHQQVISKYLSNHPDKAAPREPIRTDVLAQVICWHLFIRWGVYIHDLFSIGKIGKI